jgi:hypothetical protein
MDPAQLAHSGSPLPSFPHDVTPVSQTPTKADVDGVMVLPTQSYLEVPFCEPLNEIHKESPGTFTNEQIGMYPTLTQFYVRQKILRSKLYTIALETIPSKLQALMKVLKLPSCKWRWC